MTTDEMPAHEMPAHATIGDGVTTGERDLGRVTGLVAGVAPFSAVDGPGNRFVVFLQGCGFDCLVCHNPATIPLRPKGSHALTPVPVGELLAQIAGVGGFLTGVTVTGGEPTVQPDFVHALFTGLATDPRTAPLGRLLDSNGDAPTEVWDRLAPLIDGAMIDLKALDEQTHLVLTGRPNTQVLATIRTLAARGVLVEVRLLLVPGINDADDVLARTAAWLLEADPTVRIRVNAFQHAGTRACARDLLAPQDRDLARYRQVLSASGVTELVMPPAAPGPAWR
jgi:pyruvate formate lyase activating enzyme